MSAALLYFLTFIFCACSSLRDVLSESMMKDRIGSLSVYSVILIYSLSAQMLAAITMFGMSRANSFRNIAIKRNQDQKYVITKELLVANIYTAGAFIFYFLAIKSSLGATVNSFIDYGLGPALTGAVGSILMSEKLSRQFICSTVISIGGIFILIVDRSNGIFSIPLYGCLCALASCLCSVMYRIKFKILLNNNVEKSLIMFWRLMLTTLICGLLTVRFGAIDRETAFEIFVIGLIGFAFPLLISLYILQRVSIRRFSMVLFLLPISTYIGSIYLRHSQLTSVSCIGIALILGGVVYYEALGKKVSSAHLTHPSSTPR